MRRRKVSKGEHPAHWHVEGPRFEQRMRAVSPLVQNGLSRCELWQEKCHMEIVL